MAAKVEAAGVDVFCEFPGRSRCWLDGRPRRSACAPATRGVDKHGKPQGQLRARRRHPRPGRRCSARGRAARCAKQLEQQLGLGAGKNPQVYAIGLKEVWELPQGRLRAGRRHRTPWAGRSTATPSAAASSTACRTTWLIVGLVVGLDYREPAARSAPRVPALQDAPRDRAAARAAARWRYYGAKAIPEGGWWSMPKLCGRRLPAHRRQRRLRQRPAAQGHPPGDEVRHARRRDDLRGAAPAATPRRPRCRATRSAFEASWAGDELWEVPQLPPGLRARPVRRHAAGRRSAWSRGGRGFGVLDRLRAEAGHDRMQQPRQRRSTARPQPPAPVADRRRAHLRQAGRRLQLGHRARGGPAGPPAGRRHRHLRRPLRASSTATPASASARPRSTRWWPTPPSPTGQRLQINASQLRALQDLRHHGPLPDHHLGAARGRRRARTTGRCDGSRPAAARRPMRSRHSRSPASSSPRP